MSVIIATYNSGPLLGHALDALEAQTLPAHLIEILVVDDGSTDDTWRYLRELEGHANQHQDLPAAAHRRPQRWPQPRPRRSDRRVCLLPRC